MLEKDFVREIKHSIESSLKPCYFLKIPDQPYNPSATFNPEKHFDAFVLYKGCFSALEFKIHRSHQAFSFSKVSLIQKTALLSIAEAGGNAYVVIGIRHKNIRKAIFITIEDYIMLEKESKHKSVKLLELERFPQLMWLGSGLWQINEKLFLYGL